MRNLLIVGPAILTIAALCVITTAVDLRNSSGSVLARAANRVCSITDGKVGRLSAKIEEVDRVLGTVRDKQARATEMFRNGGGSFTDLDLVLNDVDDDLEKLWALMNEVEADSEDDVREQKIRQNHGGVAAAVH